MWGALKRDFGEFVSTVTTDATDVLAKLDENLDDGGGPRTSAPLIDADTGIPLDDNVNDEEGEVEDEVGVPADENVSPEEMRDFLMTSKDVFLDELVVEKNEGEDEADNAAAKAFLESFDLETKTDEISQLLEANPDTLEHTFSQLTDQVEYADFWKRYFYRLADDRLEQSYEYYVAAQKAQEEAAAKAKAAKRREVAAAAISGVTSFLGGVVNRLVEENNANDIDPDEDIVNDDGTPFFQSGPGPATKSAMNFLTGVAGGRPPFVLNTAVSDDDDDDDDDNGQEEEDEVEEEELGWDDDDDEEELDDEDAVHGDAEDDKNETVEFKDAEKERLQEDLEQAKAERDMLQKTVEMQSDEIKKLKEISQPQVVGNETKQVELLQMKLFEKDSELGALRAQLDDLRQDEDEDEYDKNETEAAVAAAKQEVSKLMDTVVEKDQQIALLETKVNESNNLQSLLDQLRVEHETLLSQLAEMQQAGSQASDQMDQNLQAIIATKDDEIISLKQELEKIQDDVRAERETQVIQMNGVVASAKADREQAATEANTLRAKLAAAETQIKELRGALDAGKIAVVELDAELKKTQAALREKELELRTHLLASPGSSSTGIKVSTSEDDDEPPLAEPIVHEAIVHEATFPEPVPPTASAVIAEPESGAVSGNEDDGWGDDW